MAPTTRKSSAGRSRAVGTQQKLSFNHRVTKSVPKSAKESVAASPLRKQFIPENEKLEEPEAEKEVETVEIEEQPERILATKKASTAKSDLELKAEKVSDAAIQRYWRKLESERMSKRVHQEDLSTSEKVLRYFDVTSHYGPCVGITRIKRWQRAQRLGLNPPIEVLAVLVKEDGKENKTSERAHMDEIMNATVVDP